MKKNYIFPSLLLVIVILTAGIFIKEYYNTKNPISSGPIVIRMSHVANETSPIHLSSKYFEEILEERSNGQFDVQIYPNAQLGGDRQAVESVSLNIINASFPPTAIFAGFEPNFMVTDLPFVFTTRESAYQALDNELGGELNKLLEPHNIVNLGFGETGYRHITNSAKPIRTPEDLKGLSIRTMENPIHIASFREWGANPTPINFSELFTALQQGTVDAQENPLQITSSSRFHEVQDYLSLTGHFYSSGSIIFNSDFVNGLPEDLRSLLVKCVDEMKDYERELTIEMEEQFLAELEAGGMEINELTPEEKQLFVEAALPVYEAYEDILGKELIDLATMYNE